MIALAALLLSVSPPPFDAAWIDPSSYYDVPAGHGPEIAFAALVGGYLADVHPAYMVAVAVVETGGTFSSRANGDGGKSLGLCQIQLSTARQSLPWLVEEDLLEPGVNVLAAALHFGRLIRLYGRARAPGYYGCGYDCGTTRGARVKYETYRRLVRGVR